MPLIPNTNIPGYEYVSGGTGQNAGRWIPDTDSKDYAVQGTLVVPAGAGDQLPLFIVPWNGQLLSISGVLVSGSLTLDIKQNGTSITGLTSLAVSTTVASYTPTNTTLVSVGDTLQPVLDTASTPIGMSLSLVFWKYLS
jgi:hypothetical protein